jgi:hypothetical protein
VARSGTTLPASNATSTELAPYYSGYFDVCPYQYRAGNADASVVSLLDKYKERRCELITVPSLSDQVEVVFVGRRGDGAFEVVSATSHLGAIIAGAASIDSAAVEIVSKACSGALAHHEPELRTFKDGVTLYASHWTPQGTLTGRARSLRTVSGEIVRLERILRQYVEAPSEKRSDLRQTLIVAANTLSARLAPAN